MQFVLLRNMESISIPLHLFIGLIVSPTIAGILILLDLPPMLFQHFELYFQEMYTLTMRGSRKFFQRGSNFDYVFVFVD